jgi:hypothetical protein
MIEFTKLRADRGGSSQVSFRSHHRDIALDFCATVRIGGVTTTRR